ncbi:MAG: ABC transporter ATP-binding protein [Geminicoccaceae bacterium]
MGMLDVADVHVSYDGVKALNGACLTVAEGQITSLIGPNGAGKTTLFNVVSGLVQPTAGSVRYAGHELVGRAPHAVARLGVGRAFQDPRVFRNLSALENVLAGVPHSASENPLRALLGLDRPRQRAAVERAHELLAFVGLAAKAREAAWTLSYGEQRFLSLARTLAMPARLLLLDEPTVGLDDDSISALLRLLGRMVREEGRTVLLVEHNMDVVMGISDRIALLIEGKDVAVGTPSEIAQNPLVLEAYLGVRFVAAGR